MTNESGLPPPFNRVVAGKTPPESPALHYGQDPGVKFYTHLSDQFLVM